MITVNNTSLSAISMLPEDVIIEVGLEVAAGGVVVMSETDGVKGAVGRED